MFLSSKTLQRKRPLISHFSSADIVFFLILVNLRVEICYIVTIKVKQNIKREEKTHTLNLQIKQSTFFRLLDC
jgi:hypothetical protein